MVIISNHNAQFFACVARRWPEKSTAPCLVSLYGGRAEVYLPDINVEVRELGRSYKIPLVSGLEDYFFALRVSFEKDIDSPATLVLPVGGVCVRVLENRVLFDSRGVCYDNTCG